MEIVLPLVLALIAFFILVVFVFFSINIYKRQSRIHREPDRERLTPEPTRKKFLPTLSRASPHITPFPVAQTRPSSDPGSPFEQRANMRIATRRSDGVWLFSDPSPDTPFSPAGTSELAPSPSVTSLLLREKRSRCNSQPTHQFDSIEPPPPAYTQGSLPDKAPLPLSDSIDK